MASKLQQILSGIDAANLDICTLEAIKSHTARKIENNASTTCLFLDKAPAEIRNRIYEYTAIAEISQNNFDTIKHSGLLAATKQIRHEYMAVIYSSKIICAEYYDVNTSTWIHIQHHKHIKAIMDKADFSNAHNTGHRIDIERYEHWCKRMKVVEDTVNGEIVLCDGAENQKITRRFWLQKSLLLEPWEK